MAHMQKQVDYFSAWTVDTTCGTELVLLDVAGVAGLPCDLTLKTCLPFLEGEPVNSDSQVFGDGIDEVTGWFGRLSAPGYLDCTGWSGPIDTTQEVLEHLSHMYGEDEEEAARW